MRGLTVLLLVCAVLSVPRPAAAQPARGGTWIGVGLGGGWTRVSCAICRRDRDLGPGGHVRFGTTLQPGLRLGAEVQGWTHENESDVRATVGSLAAAVQLYPRPDGGVFFKGGLGYVRYGAKADRDDTGVSTGLLGLLVGAGYEFRIAPGLSITNEISLVASSFGALRRDRTSVTDDVSVSLLQLGIGLTRH